MRNNFFRIEIIFPIQRFFSEQNFSEWVQTARHITEDFITSTNVARYILFYLVIGLLISFQCYGNWYKALSLLVHCSDFHLLLFLCSDLSSRPISIPRRTPALFIFAHVYSSAGIPDFSVHGFCTEKSYRIFGTGFLYLKFQTCTENSVIIKNPFLNDK